MTDALWQWPPAASVGRVVPKTKFYEHARVSAKLRAAFVGEVERITWAYKLGPDTIGLRGDEAVPEIQVFVIDAKPGQVVSEPVLAAIDKTVHTPIIFEERAGRAVGAGMGGGEGGGDGLDGGRGAGEQGGRVRTRAAYKRPGPRGPVVGEVLDGVWFAGSDSRAPLPAALDLAGLYSRLLAALLPLPVRAGEGLPEALERVALANRLAREVDALERRMRAETQPNRRLDLHRRLKAAAAEYDAVVAPER